MNPKKLLLLILLISSASVFAQSYTISGYVEDAESGERLLGASVYNVENRMEGTVTNHFGFFSLTIPEGKKKIVFSFIGFDSQIKEVNLTSDTKLNIALDQNNTLAEVTVKAKRSEVENTQMSKVDIPMELVSKMPSLLGEVDILKTIQMLPGVQGGSEGTSGLYVRGGGPDQNLILLDGVPVYNASHLFGFFSVFNASAISDVSLTKGGFPARYGGRLSSVLDIRMKEGSNKKFKGEVGIGLISSKLTLEGPIIRDKMSFIVSARRTYIDILAAPLIKMMANSDGVDAKVGYYFYDVNAKLNYILSDKDRFYLSVYTGQDVAYSDIEDSNGVGNDQLNFGLDWGNLTVAGRWNHVFNPKLFSNTTLTFSSYKFKVGIEELIEDGSGSQSRFSIDYLSGIEDFGAKTDFEYSPNTTHSIRFGASAILHQFKPGVASFKETSTGTDDLDLSFGDKTLSTNEIDVYFEDEIRFTEKFTANLGVHFSTFGVRDTTFFSIQPRASLRYLFTERFSLKMSYAKMQQSLHLLSTSGFGLPTDLWLPATNNVLPQKSDQVALGASIKLSDAYHLTTETFYKYMNNLVEYKEGSSFFEWDESSEDLAPWESKVTQGKGWAYGLEVLIQKKTGKLRGWIGYTLSRSDRQFEDLSFGKKFPYRYDRRHDVNVMLSYTFNKKVDIGLTWVYGTGNAISLSLEKYPALSDYQLVEHYETRNNYRMPAYHRLDIGVNVHKEKKHGNQTWSFGLYNAYSRRNPYFLRFSDDGAKQRLLQTSLFPIIPSIAYNYKF